MMKQGNVGGASHRAVLGWEGLRIGFLACFVLILAGFSAPAAPRLTLEDPTAFFTNVAARLLRSELNLDLNQIQVYPTNQYTPAVHRLLQLTANIYDAATNRSYGISDATNGFPSVFRPLFRQIQTETNSLVIIAGYREVLGAGLANAATAPPMIDLDSGYSNAIPVLGTPFDPSDSQEPMVSGVPLVLGAREGFPNFNEFGMEPCFFVSRLLEFRRAVTSGPVTQTNQMFVVAVSNIFGLEAWNSYTNPYPRNLQVNASVTLTATVTNELGSLVLSNWMSDGTITNIAGGSWPGWLYANAVQGSFLLPWGHGSPFVILTNSSYINQPPWFVPQTHIFANLPTNQFYVPRWWLNLKTQLQFTLVDTDANRIVDYVNLQSSEPALDINSKLSEGAICNGSPTLYVNPADQWCTNRFHGSPDAPTIGIINQIGVGLQGASGAGGPPSAAVDPASFSLDPYSGLDSESAIDGFRYNLMGLSPIFAKDQGKVFYKSNVFYAPFDPYRPIYVHVSWQANDPLVHYTSADLTDLSLTTNRVNFTGYMPPLQNLGQINTRYQPWGGNPYGSIDRTLDFQVAVKDPFVTRPDAWNFPNGSGLDIGSLGRVHRGTPWQTVFLKSTNILAQTPSLPSNLAAWQKWTGNAVVRPGPAKAGGAVADAMFTVPTNDWHLVSLLAPLFSTNDLRTLASVNQTRGSAWTALLDGMTVLTDIGQPQLQPVLMSSNSPQAATIAAALDATRAAQPAQAFDSIGAILATPELSIASPWLSTTNLGLIISDNAVEMIPSQLLPLLRPDSIGSIVPAGGAFQIQFSGVDDYAYAIQFSSNLVDWTTLSTNYPDNGLFYFLQPSSANSAQSFYRTVLLP